MAINKDNGGKYIIHVDDKNVLFFDGNLNLVEVLDRKKEEGYENNIKNNIKTLRKQILELQSIFDKIVEDMGNEDIKQFHDIRYDITQTIKRIEEMIGGEDEQ